MNISFLRYKSEVQDKQGRKTFGHYGGREERKEGLLKNCNLSLKIIFNKKLHVPVKKEEGR